MTQPTEPTEQGEDRSDDLPKNPRENPADTVDALEEKVSGEFPDQPEENEKLPGAGGSETGTAEPPA